MIIMFIEFYDNIAPPHHNPADTHNTLILKLERDCRSNKSLEQKLQKRTTGRRKNKTKIKKKHEKR